jgi:hypothetical protein
LENLAGTRQLTNTYADGACIDAWAYGDSVTRIVLNALNDYVRLYVCTYVLKYSK